MKQSEKVPAQWISSIKGMLLQGIAYAESPKQKNNIKSATIKFEYDTDGGDKLSKMNSKFIQEVSKRNVYTFE